MGVETSNDIAFPKEAFGSKQSLVQDGFCSYVLFSSNLEHS